MCVCVYTSDCSGHLPGGHWKDGTADAAPRGWRPLYGSMRTAQVVVARVKLQGAVSGVPFPLPCADLRLHHQGGEKVGFGDSMTNGFRVQEGTKIWRPEVSGGRSAPSAMGGLHRPRWAVCTVIGGRSAPSSMGGMHRPRRREGCVAQLGGWLVKAPACC